MRTKILITFMAVFLANYNSWGQKRVGTETISFSSIEDQEVIKFVSGTHPQAKNDSQSDVLLDRPSQLGGAVNIPVGGTASIAYPASYGAGSPVSKTFFIIFFH